MHIAGSGRKLVKIGGSSEPVELLPGYGPSISVFSILSLGCILISDLVVTNLFMYSLPGIILLYLATPFLHQWYFCMRYHYFCKVHACTAIGPELLTHI